MAVHDADELRRAGRLALRTSRASLMSDTKWRKLFAGLDDANLRLEQCFFKLIDNSEELASPVPRRAHLQAPRAWLDSPKWGPIPWRAIEWARFPTLAKLDMADRTIPARTRPQDIGAAVSVIESIGRYPIELTDDGLCVRGYVVD